MLADCMTLTKRLNATGIFQYIVPTRVYGTHATEVGEPALARARQSGSPQRQQPCAIDLAARIAGQSTLSSWPPVPQTPANTTEPSAAV